MAVLVFKSHLFHLIMTPECKSSDASNSDMPKRGFEVLSSQFNKENGRGRGGMYVEVTKVYNKNQSLSIKL